MHRERGLVTYPTWERYTVLAHYVACLNVRDRRRIFQIMRAHEDSSNIFLPEYGITISEFATWYTLGDRRRRDAAAAVVP